MSGTSRGSIDAQDAYLSGALDEKLYQVGGDHYLKMPIQPFDIVEANGLDFWQGNIIKYVVRFRDKGGVEDLKKARHYLDRLIKIEQKNKGRSPKWARRPWWRRWLP